MSTKLRRDAIVLDAYTEAFEQGRIKVECLGHVVPETAPIQVLERAASGSRTWYDAQLRLHRLEAGGPFLAVPADCKCQRCGARLFPVFNGQAIRFTVEAEDGLFLESFCPAGPPTKMEASSCR